LGEYSHRVWQRGWAIVVSGIGGALGLIALTVPPHTVASTAIAPAHTSPLVPTWLWLSLLLGGIMVAQFLAFHDVRMERDAAHREIQQRFDSIRYRFEMTGLTGGAVKAQVDGMDGPQTGYLFGLVFANGGAEMLQYEVESLDITVGTHSSPDNGFSSSGGVILPGRNTRFRCPWIPSPIGDGDVLPAGRGEYVVSYGHPSGGTRFSTRHKFVIGWESNLEGVTEATWLDDGAITHEIVSTAPANA
jgi:hypothetical protein